MTPHITRIAILDRIAHHFLMATGFISSGIGQDFGKYLTRAESCIEILEIEDCGSIGGYDPKNPNRRVVDHMLFNRFLTLVAKYPELRGDIQLSCGFTLDTLASFYNAIGGLRNKAVQGTL